MRFSLKRNLIAAVFLLLSSFLVIACSKKTPEAQAKAASKTSYELLEYIPADSPYFFGGIEEAPKDVRDKFADIYEKVGDAYWDIIKSGLEKDGGDIEELLNSDNPWARAFVNEIYVDGEIKKDVFKNFGLSMKSTGGVYGNGLLPVLRIKLDDATRLEKTIARIEKNAEEEIPSIKIGANKVWSISPDHNDIQILFTIDNGYFVASISPDEVDDSVLKQILGFDKPKNTLADSKYLHQIMKDKSYLPYALGFLDVEKFARPFIDGPAGFNEVLFSLSDKDKLPHEELSAVCKKEFKELIKVAPRLLLGTTKYDTKDVNLEYLLELRPDLAKEMTGLTSPVPGLGEANGLFSMGFSFNIENMQKFALDRIAAIKADPYKCDKFSKFNNDLSDLEAKLSNPAVGFMQGLRGFNFVIDDFDKSLIEKMLEADFEELSDNEQKEFFVENLQDSIGGYTLISVENSKNLYNMAKMFSPEIAALELKSDGKARRINAAFPKPVPFDVFAIMQDKAFVLTAGKNANNKAKKVAQLEAGKNTPLLSYSLDYGLLSESMRSIFVNPAVMEAMEEENSEELEEFLAMKNLIEASYGYLNTGTINFRLREDGIAFEYDISMK